MTTSDAPLDRRADLLVDAKDRLLEDLVGLRKQHDLSQQTVAERMGVSQPTVAAFERYDANPTLSSIIRYAMAVEALLDIKVVDDCGDGVPATWQMTGAAQTTIRVSMPPRKTQPIADGWSVTQEPVHA
ncbi:MAG: helix-turn-helix transcriptional regulator [Schaalia hyovaginalis]|uniref:helix-turn-helix domain-containing protein n=1 Tax=Schaalia hyovaginalis TaxID=29316 RepID=UPI0026EFF15A|nr:helix-turn-helix transcriptional regulator [Schaalia hyovaginalis]MCI7513470.1 helix-turn-helix domain-containing protein [Schaalia hyovaginalis]MDY3666342.1 helix-turn-helix transcriptional regulator [Schaalia hyovaginalis]MDY4263139.1 helix-turn-helix transcriptional regulator [Schaalia hyovaginalis]